MTIAEARIYSRLNFQEKISWIMETKGVAKIRATQLVEQWDLKARACLAGYYRYQSKSRLISRQGNRA